MGAVTGWVTIVGTQWRRNSRGAQASTPSLKGPQIDLSSKSWWDRHIQCQMHAVEVSRCSLDSMDLSIVIEPNFLQCLNSTNDRTASTAFLKMFVGRAAHRLHSRNYWRVTFPSAALCTCKLLPSVQGNIWQQIGLLPGPSSRSLVRHVLRSLDKHVPRSVTKSSCTSFTWEMIAAMSRTLLWTSTAFSLSEHATSTKSTTQLPPWLHLWRGYWRLGIAGNTMLS